MSRIVGVVTVKLPVAGGILIKAYHAPEFSSNIVSVAWLQLMCEVLF